MPGCGLTATTGLAGLDVKSRRPESSPWQAAPAVEAAVCEMRREHPKWGALRIAFELGREAVRVRCRRR